MITITADHGPKPISLKVLLTIHDTALRYGVPFLLLLALAYHESGFSPQAVNVNPASGDSPETTDYGLLQINSYWHPTFNLTLWAEPWYNLAYGCDLLLAEYAKHQDWYTAAWMWSTRDLAWETYQAWLSAESAGE